MSTDEKHRFKNRVIADVSMVKLREIARFQNKDGANEFLGKRLEVIGDSGVIKMSDVNAYLIDELLPLVYSTTSAGRVFDASFYPESPVDETEEDGAVYGREGCLVVLHTKEALFVLDTKGDIEGYMKEALA